MTETLLMQPQSTSSPRGFSTRSLLFGDLPVLPEAACKGEYSDLFFGPHVCGRQCDGPRGCYEAKAEQGRFERIREAKKICGACPVIEKCLRWALDTRQPYGIWGGTTERERRDILKKEAAGG